MGLNIDKVRSRLTSLQNQTQKQDSLWKPPAGKSQIRIVPYKFNKDNPFIELLFHYNIAGKSYLSPASFGRPDPFIEFAEKLRASGDKEEYKMSKNLEPKLRTFAPIVVRGEEEKGVKFWGFGKTVYQELLGVIADPDYGDITDPANGRDIVVEFKTAEETGKSYPTTTIRVKPNKSMLVETKEAFQKIADTQKDITEIYKELSYEDLQSVLKNWLKPENQKKSAEGSTEAGAPAETPVKKEEAKPAVSTATNLDDVSKKFDELFSN
jgi:hypothetical protein